MGNKTHRHLQLKLDNASGTLTDISPWVNQADMNAAIAMLDQTGLGRSFKSNLAGLGDLTWALNGFVNTTTEGIFGTAATTGSTSVTHTIQLYNGVKYYNTEVFLGDIKFSGNSNSIQTFSCTCAAGTSIINRTSVSL